MIIMLQKLMSWAQQHQFLWRFHELYYMLIINNNLVTKINILSSVISIFAEITYIIICLSCDNNYVVKIDVLTSVSSIFVKIMWIIICWIMNNNYVTKIDVLSSAFSIFVKIMWIMLQNLTFWALQLQYLQKSCEKSIISLVWNKYI